MPSLICPSFNAFTFLSSIGPTLQILKLFPKHFGRLNFFILNKELIINSTPDGFDIALLEDKHLTELHQDRKSNQFTVGDIFLGKIKKVMPGLNAASGCVAAVRPAKP